MNKKFLFAFSAYFASLLPLPMAAQSFTLQNQTLDNPDNEPAAVHPLPSARQLKWQETEFYAFFHYGMNTYTGQEWGYGDEDVNRFAPTTLPNPRQWIETAKAAGMKGGIAVVKHHDGFCLWPTTTTDHHCQNSSNSFARQTNIPQAFADASRELGMKYGFYISPWDRNSVHYGTDKYVKDVFLRQCFELGQYGNDQFEMWFDGANGGDGYYGGKRTTVNVGNASSYYDIPNLRDSVHKMAPNCVMWGVGGEARWIGNEAGWAGETNWSMGYNMYGDENEWLWHPGESDAKATNRGWFWHEGESPLGPERLFQMYLETVGRNATLILNLPPDKAGVLPPATVNSLTSLGQLLQQRLSHDLAKTATITASDTRTAGAARSYDVRQLTDDNKDTYWASNDGNNSATLTLEWPSVQNAYYVELMEPIAKGQRIKRFKIETSEDGTNFTPAATDVQTTTVGYKRIVPLQGNTTHSHDRATRIKALRIIIEDAKSCPLLSRVAVY